eukprot:TRINITY_DN13283_c0_g1_i1.p1 TRINITY_DN13283_c0_g1~~TRINITY_DN13283_c0_g1_i1.p1  ORF type:complete len:261 (+),score=64.06 TRINITY_DN13283_c0_g1_i1:53-835(+)
MPRGPKKHLKRVNAPNMWMLDKMTGVFAPRPRAGPHKFRESLPLVVIIRNKLKYALSYREALMILMQRLVQVDAKVRTDLKYPVGFMDVVSINATGEHFRILYNVKGRFQLHRVDNSEASFKLLKVKRAQMGPGGIPYIATHDGRTIRYPHPDIKVNDVVRYNLESGEIEKHIPFTVGNVVMVTGGRNLGRVGILHDIEKHDGAQDVAHVEDLAHNTFTTLLSNIFTIGEGSKPLITLPAGGGVKLSILEQKRQKENREY